jgi:hypothetical protein
MCAYKTRAWIKKDRRRSDKDEGYWPAAAAADGLLDEMDGGLMTAFLLLDFTDAHRIGFSSNRQQIGGNNRQIQTNF